MSGQEGTVIELGLKLAEPVCPEALTALVGDLLDLAGRFENAGYRSSAALLVGAAYGLCDNPQTDDGGFRGRAA